MSKKAKASYVWKPWSLWTHGVSWSFLEVFLRNRAECDLIHRQGWRQRAIPHFIEFGQVFHHIMERGYRLYKAPPTRRACQEMANGYIIRQAKKGLIKNRIATQEQADLAAVVAHRYFHYYKTDFSGRWRNLEHRFQMPYVYSDGKVTRINGVIDAEWYEGDKHWVLDTKTKSELPIEETLDEFPLNFQVNCYALYVLTRDKTPPHGCVLNLVRRPGERMTQKKDGNSRTNFLNRISSNIRDDPKHYFARPSYPLSKKEILDWKKRQLDPIMQELRMWEEGELPTYVNPCGLYVKRRRTDFFDAMVNDDFSMLAKRT